MLSAWVCACASVRDWSLLSVNIWFLPQLMLEEWWRRNVFLDAIASQQSDPSLLSEERENSLGCVGVSRRVFHLFRRQEKPFPFPIIVIFSSTFPPIRFYILRGSSTQIRRSQGKGKSWENFPAPYRSIYACYVCRIVENFTLAPKNKDQWQTWATLVRLTRRNRPFHPLSPWLGLISITFFIDFLARAEC